jgi:hypothetical protein
MKVVLTDGFSFDVGNYKAVEGGLVLTDDEERENVVGFLPYDSVQFVLPDEVAEQRELARQSGGQTVGQADQAPRQSGSVQQQPQQQAAGYPRPRESAGQATQSPPAQGYQYQSAGDARNPTPR